MAITGAVAGAVRQFDPYPEFDHVRVFKGRPETGGRQFYKTAGLIVPRFEMVPGVQIVGGAGFGQREINAAWRGARADEPLIGDGGLRNAEARTNSIRNPVASGAVAGVVGAGGSLPTYWAVANDGASKGIATEVVGVGSEAGVPGVYIRWFGTATGVGSTGIMPDSVGAAYATGSTVAAETFQKLIAASKPVRTLALQAVDLPSFANTTSYLLPGAVLLKGAAARVLSGTSARVYIIINYSLGTEIDQTVFIGAPQLKNGPDINDPPIQQESGLPATRTGYSYRESGRDIQPVHYGVAKVRMLAPLANHAVTYPHLLEFKPTSGGGRVLWLADKGGAGTHGFSVQDATVTGPTLYFGTLPIGTWQTLAWAVRDGGIAASLNGAAVLTAAMGALPPAMSWVGLLGNAIAAGGNTANAEMPFYHTWNGEISNDNLRALSARFAA